MIGWAILGAVGGLFIYEGWQRYKNAPPPPQKVLGQDDPLPPSPQPQAAPPPATQQTGAGVVRLSDGTLALVTYSGQNSPLVMTPGMRVDVNGASSSSNFGETATVTGVDESGTIAFQVGPYSVFRDTPWSIPEGTTLYAARA